MKRTALALTFVMTLIFSFLFRGILIQLVESQSFDNIFIRADGSVEGTDKIRRDGDVYTFTGDIGTDEGSYGIIVEKDNIVIDGAGYLLKGAGAAGYFEILRREKQSIAGIVLHQRKNVTIMNLQITEFNGGFSGGNNTNIKILGNNITNNSVGVYFQYVSFITISGNSITNHGGNGMSFEACTNSTFSENNIASNRQGIQIQYYSSNNLISGNNIAKNRVNGIDIRCNFNIFSGNNVADNDYGISIVGINNTVSGNNIIDNKKWGVGLGRASNNIFSGNNITNNYAGIKVAGVFNNMFHNNNFVNNTMHVYDLGVDAPLSAKLSWNFWNDNENGNYWSDYLTRYPNASEIGDSGIGDTPYVIYTDNIDNYPLMASIKALSPENKTYDTGNIPLTFKVNEPVWQITYSLDEEANVTITGNTTLTGLTEGMHNVTAYATDPVGNTVASQTIHFIVDFPPSVLLLSPQNQTYMSINVPLTFTVNEPVSWMGYSLDGQDTVAVAGNTTLTGLPAGAHNITVYAKDSAGNTGDSDTVYFSKEIAFLPIVLVIAGSTAVVGIGLSVYFKKRKR